MYDADALSPARKSEPSHWPIPIAYARLGDHTLSSTSRLSFSSEYHPPARSCIILHALLNV
jgi:hypothetical protein